MVAMPIENPSSQATFSAENFSSSFPLFLPGGRLSLVQNDPTGSATDAATLFYVPYASSFVPVWNDSTNAWENAVIPSAGVSISFLPLPNASADVVAFGSPGLEVRLAIQGWAGNTARLFPLSSNGLRCLDYGAGANPRYRTYLGSIRTTGTGSASRLQDSNQFRHVWNAYNQIAKTVSVYENAASWLYSGTAGRLLNNNANNRVELMSGLVGQSLDVSGKFSAYVPAGSGAYFAIAANGSYDASTLGVIAGLTPGETSVDCRYTGRSILGVNTIQAFESTGGGGTATIYGYGRNGLRGVWLC